MLVGLPVLPYTDLRQTFMLHCEVSSSGVGRVLRGKLTRIFSDMLQPEAESNREELRCKPLGALGCDKNRCCLLSVPVRFPRYPQERQCSSQVAEVTAEFGGTIGTLAR